MSDQLGPRAKVGCSSAPRAGGVTISDARFPAFDLLRAPEVISQVLVSREPAAVERYFTGSRPDTPPISRCPLSSTVKTHKVLKFFLSGEASYSTMQGPGTRSSGKPRHAGVSDVNRKNKGSLKTAMRWCFCKGDRQLARTTVEERYESYAHRRVLLSPGFDSNRHLGASLRRRIGALSGDRRTAGSSRLLMAEDEKSGQKRKGKAGEGNAASSRPPALFAGSCWPERLLSQEDISSEDFLIIKRALRDHHVQSPVSPPSSEFLTTNSRRLC